MNRYSISWRAGLMLALWVVPVVLPVRYADAAQAPLPRERPGAVSVALALAPATATPTSAERPSKRDGTAQLKAALDAISRERYREAILISEGLDSLLDRRLISWMVARAP